MKTSNWSNTQKELLKGLLGDVRTKFLGYNSLNKRTTQGVPFPKLSDYDLILGYDNYYNIYVAWSASAHRIIDRNAKEHTFSLSVRYATWINAEAPMICFYQRIEGTKKPAYTALEYYEKIVLIREAYIEEFCKHPLLYLMPNRDDTQYKENTVFEDAFSHKLLVSNSHSDGMWYSSEERKRYCCTHLCREASFRDRVLNAYNRKCAICGESIEEVLQAAHILAVKDGGSDDTQNGICLCANHHLMYDSGLFHIDTVTKRIWAVDERIKDKVVEKCISSEK